MRTLKAPQRNEDGEREAALASRSVSCALAIVRDATLLTTGRAETEKIRDAGLCAIEFSR